jgi:chorismate mutase
MGNIMIAPLGDNPDALFLGIRDFPVEKVVLVARPGQAEAAERLAQELRKFKIDSTIRPLSGNLLESMFQIINDTRKAEQNREIIINLGCASKQDSLAALSAAYVNGIKAVGVLNERLMPLPVLEYSYYDAMSERKAEILKLLEERLMSLDEISKKTRMSLPLISYHINGNIRSKGLIALGLIEKANEGRKKGVRISPLGRLIVQGITQ